MDRGLHISFIWTNIYRKSKVRVQKVAKMAVSRLLRKLMAMCDVSVFSIHPVIIFKSLVALRQSTALYQMVNSTRKQLSLSVKICTQHYRQFISH